jgi:hypothetical protein
MALIKADRVKESSTSTGASTFALAGAYTGFRSFSSVCSVGDTFYYVIDSDLGSQWETGLGTYSAVNTLTRTTVHSSSNSNNIVTFSAGTKNVYISLTGNQLATLSTLAGSETLTNKTINASNNTITNVSLTSGVTGTLPLANGGTGTTTAQLAINALAGAVTSGSYLRGNGTNVVMATIAAGDVPTLNQSTTGTASGSVSGTASYVAKFTGTNVVGNSLIYDNGTNVGIGTTSPADRLEVYGATNKNVKIGTAAGGLDTSSYNPDISTLGGIIGFQTGITTDYRGSIYAYADASSNAKLAISSRSDIVFISYKGSNTDSRAMVIKETTGNVGIGTNSPSSKFDVNAGTGSNFRAAFAATNQIEIGNYSAASGYREIYIAGSPVTFYTGTAGGTSASERMRIDASGNIGIGTSSPGAQLHVTTAAAATKGLIVKGASAQSANLQEWQNNAGTVLAQIDSAGNANLRSFGIYDYSRSAGNTADYKHNCLFRNIPDTVGDYVEIGELTTTTLWEIEVLAWRAAYDATYGTLYNLIRKKYYLTTRYLSQGIVIPDFVSNEYSTFNDFELELVNNGIGIATRLRLRRTIAVAGALTGFQAMIKIIGAATYPAGAGVSEMSGTGTSALSLAYRSVGYNTARYSYIYPPPPAGGSGSGMPLYVSGGDAVGTGDGGSVILQSGAFSTSGSNGKVIVRGLASNTVNLQEWQNSAGTALVSIRSDGVFYVNKDSVYTDYTGQIVLQGATNNNKRLVFGIDTTNNIGFMQSYLNSGGTSYPIILQPNNNGTATVGIGGVTAPDAQLHVASHLAARKGLIVRGASGQTANLTEWQNNSGSVFASIDNNYGASFWGWSGNVPSGGIEQVCLSAGNKSYWSANDAALMVIGYVGLAGVYDGTSWSMYFKTGTAGATTEKMRLTGGGLLGIGTTSPAGQLHTQASAATTKSLVVRGASAQSANLQEWQDNAGSTLAAVLSNGAIQPASMADSAAANNTIYYSTTASKLVYKNSAGTVNNLY